MNLLGTTGYFANLNSQGPTAGKRTQPMTSIAIIDAKGISETSRRQYRNSLTIIPSSRGVLGESQRKQDKGDAGTDEHQSYNIQLGNDFKNLLYEGFIGLESKEVSKGVKTIILLALGFSGTNPNLLALRSAQTSVIISGDRDAGTRIANIPSIIS